jgi:Zn-dependent M28 family amino/carboxypeptidase
MQEFSDDRRNVVARYGSEDRHILIAAHYDGQAGMPAASDNAAGVAMLIELGRELRAMNLPVSLVLVAFDDEEQGLNGSTFYVENPTFPLEQISAAIVFDTMGRSFIDLKATTLFVLGTEYSAALAGVVSKYNRPDTLVAGADLIGPRSDFAPFAAHKVPFIFFSHATHKDYHGAGDRPELLDYPKLTQDSNLIERMIVDIARLSAKPVYLDKPVYPAKEVDTLLSVMQQARNEKSDLAMGYRLVFDDLERRIQTDRSRSTLNVAASTLLALATPRLSSFLLDFVVIPAYEKDNKPEIVRALREESSRSQR